MTSLPDSSGPATPLATDQFQTLPLTRCRHCDYLLCGLPPEGRCPECGQAYNQTLIVFWGWNSGTKTAFASGGWVAAILVLLLRLALVGIPVLALSLGCLSAGGPQGLLFLIPVLMSSVMAVGRTLERRPTGEIVVCMNELGFFQEDNLPEGHWTVRGRALIWPACGICLGLFWLVTLLQVMQHSPEAGVPVVLVAGMTGLGWYGCRAYRNGNNMTPWAAATMVHFRRLNDEKCVLELWTKRDKDLPVPVVEAVIACSADQETALLERLKAWTPDWDSVQTKTWRDF